LKSNPLPACRKLELFFRTVDFSKFDLTFRSARAFPVQPLHGYALKQFTGWLIIGVLRHQLAHHGQLQQGLFEGVDAGFGCEQGVEVLGQALPAGGKVSGIGGLSQAAERKRSFQDILPSR